MPDRMKLQSSIEFLTTYSFLFLLIGIVLSFLFFFSSAPRSTIPGQCISGGGVFCSSVEDYVNFTKHYSLLTFSFTNSQSVPINVLSMSIYINNANSIASGCLPTVEYPGGIFTCVAAMNQVPSIGSTVSGYYTINTLYCNSGISSLQNNCTTGSNIQYSGSFTTPASSTKPLLFSVLTLLGPQNQQISSFQTNPQAIPSGYTRIQNGGWSTVTSSYGFGSKAYQNQNFIGVQIAPFSLSTSSLGSNSVSCAGNYNSILSMAYSVVYLPPPITGTGGVSIYANNAIEFYYSGSSLSWSNLLGGAAWHSNQIPTQYGPSSIPFSSGINYLAILWSHDCGPGVQAINVAGLPGSASTTTTTSTSSTSTTSTSTTSTSTTSTTTSTSTSTSSTSTSSTSTTSTTTTTSTSTTIEYLYCISGATGTSTLTPISEYTNLITTGGMGAFSSTTSYPLSIDFHQCVSSNGYVYCVGGSTSASLTRGGGVANAYYGPITSSGVTSWTATTSYPFVINSHECVASGGYIYCIAGYSSGDTSQSYYAPLSSSGIGTWTATTAYPAAIDGFACTTSGGYVYCMGAANPSVSGAAYYAPLSSAGIGSWTSTNSYPITAGYSSCTTYNSNIYCMGGTPAMSSVYYAPISSGGIGSWVSTNSYPLTIELESCWPYNGYINCVGGWQQGNSAASQDYYAAVLSNGALGAWTSTSAYPVAIASQQCVLR